MEPSEQHADLAPTTLERGVELAPQRRIVLAHGERDVERKRRARGRLRIGQGREPLLEPHPIRGERNPRRPERTICGCVTRPCHLERQPL
jgi:hypothetical protein